MSRSAEEFVEFALSSGCLRLGQFTLKSGKVAPYFFDMGRIHTGKDLSLLGGFFAGAILEAVGEDFDLVFGPAYKGIPLATATAIALHARHGLDRPVGFDRKEAKAHGETGRFLGREPRDGDRIVIVDDVITTGGTKDQVLTVLSQAARISVACLVVGIDRREKEPSGQSALQSFSERHRMKARALATAYDLLRVLERREATQAEVLSAYLAENACPE